jgi:hypothetical protein
MMNVYRQHRHTHSMRHCKQEHLATPPHHKPYNTKQSAHTQDCRYAVLQTVTLCDTTHHLPSDPTTVSGELLFQPSLVNCYVPTTDGWFILLTLLNGIQAPISGY